MPVSASPVPRLLVAPTTIPFSAYLGTRRPEEVPLWEPQQRRAFFLSPAIAGHSHYTHASARARAHSPIELTIITQERCCCARHAARAAPAALCPLCTTARTQRLSLLYRTPHAAPIARGGLAARAAPLSCSGFPPFSWPAVLSSYLQRIAPRATPARAYACTHAHARTTDERTTRRAVRRRG